jgi:Ca2+/Na+ antiporter
MTILAWGNCLGDMSADVAMTKKGFGEMAITATMAGPIFNVMIGGFLSNLGWLVSNPGKSIDFTAYDGDGNVANVAYLPIVMIAAQLCVLVGLLMNALINKFEISFKPALINCIVYLGAISFLVYWAIKNDLSVS